nr:MAG: pilin [bacterium]
MIKGRQGFTLIELLIVVVIIGILAAIAIPKFSKTRERAYFSAMKSDLKNLAAEQEIYYSDPANNYQYAPDLERLNFSPSGGVSIELEATTAGWWAKATHQALDESRFCVYYWGDASPSAPATVTGVVACTGE